MVKKKYHLIRYQGHWRLKREGAGRSLINFKNRMHGDDFETVLSATMTYADDMQTLCIHKDDGTVRVILREPFIRLWREA